MTHLSRRSEISDMQQDRQRADARNEARADAHVSRVGASLFEGTMFRLV